MKIINLTENVQTVYTANAYLVMSDWKTLADTTVLIDTGQDVDVLGKLRNINTGLGKKKIDKIILTHNHSDHSALVEVIMNEYRPELYAHCRVINGVSVDSQLYDGQFIRVGDIECEIFHITVHSYDSVCVYCEKGGCLFSGDTSFPIKFDNRELENENKETLLRLSKKIVTTVYPGHGDVLHFKKGDFEVFTN